MRVCHLQDMIMLFYSLPQQPYADASLLRKMILRQSLRSSLSHRIGAGSAPRAPSIPICSPRHSRGYTSHDSSH